MEFSLMEQKVEFLQMELEEVCRREDNLKRVNNSLLQAINSDPSMHQEQALSELKKSNDHYISELSLLKSQHKEELKNLDKQLQELFLAKKELQIDLKHLKATAESEKCELLSKIKQLESERMSNNRNPPNASTVEKTPKEQLRQSIVKTLSDSRGLSNKENAVLRGKLEILSTKLHSKKEKIRHLKERNYEKTLRARIEELEEELETYKMICKKQGPLCRQETEKILRKELEDAYLTIEKLKRSGTEKSVNELKYLLGRKDSEIKDLKSKNSAYSLEIEKINAELSKYSLKLQQNEIYWAMSDGKRTETEIALKNEIKFLIGKLLKAKSRVGDPNEVTSKQSMVTTVRSKSVKKNGKLISPLDLSMVTRADSPFCVSHIDL